ncbi:MAG: peptidase T, partial [Sediminibacterium sp.]
MLEREMYTAADRLMRYVQIDTTSDPDSTSFPSTKRQLDLSRLLVDELKNMGIADVLLNEDGYVIARIPSNVAEKVPVICFCSHVDTSSDCPGSEVKPILHENYDGSDIVLPDDRGQVISISEFPYLKNHLGKSVITASGKTLLGADDKAGIAIIMNAMEVLQKQTSIPHGPLVILFTPDEETGRGPERLNVEELGANVGYTLDGGELGMYEEETFNADEIILTFEGVAAHPGYAKNKMINAIKAAASFLEKLNTVMPAPERTEGREGFIHPHTMNGTAESASIRLLIRDFDEAELVGKKNVVDQLAREIAGVWGIQYQLELREQYRSMKPIVDQYPQIRLHTEVAYQRAGVDMTVVPVRGGTDGSRLSHLGLPCTNIFTGMQGIHSRREWVGVSDMERSVDVLFELVQVWA